MAIFQCENCGCIENTNYTDLTIDAKREKGPKAYFNWSGIEDRIGKKLCCACLPSEYVESGIRPRLVDGTLYGEWHGYFKREFLPKGVFTTNRQGRLEHKYTGSTDIEPYILKEEEKMEKIYKVMKLTEAIRHDAVFTKDPAIETIKLVLCPNDIELTLNEKGAILTFKESAIVKLGYEEIVVQEFENPEDPKLITTYRGLASAILSTFCKIDYSTTPTFQVSVEVKNSISEEGAWCGHKQPACVKQN